MFDNADSCLMWQGVQTITDYKGKSSWAVPVYAHFEADNTEPSRKTLAAPDDPALSEADIKEN
jgi:hypothetical protein